MAEPPRISDTIVRDEERGFAASVHLFGVVPLWAFLFLAAMWIYFKERSREIVFHVQQALVFQIVLLAIFVVYLAVQMFTIPVQVISPDFANLIREANNIILGGCYIFFALVCIFGAIRVYMGHAFLYPFFGRQVYESSRTKYTPEG